MTDRESFQHDMQARARLEAAAPYMLEALKSAEQHVENIYVLREIRSAIAHAEGTNFCSKCGAGWHPQTVDGKLKIVCIACENETGLHAFAEDAIQEWREQ